MVNKKSIYSYFITGLEKHLNIRLFTDNQKQETHERQKGICSNCGEHLEIENMQGDHLAPWHLGGKTTSKTAKCYVNIVIEENQGYSFGR